MSEKVSGKTPYARLPPMIQKLIERDPEILVHRIEDGPDGQERDRPCCGRRRDCRAFHIDGEGT